MTPYTPIHHEDEWAVIMGFVAGRTTLRTGREIRNPYVPDRYQYFRLWALGNRIGRLLKKGNDIEAETLQQAFNFEAEGPKV